jgi:putative DNA primase/helicase
VTTDERFIEGAQLPRNDDGNALRVKHYLGDELRYVKTLDQWYHWDDRRWHRATDADMIRVGRIVAHYVDLETPTINDADQRTQHRQHAGRSHHARAIKAMVDLARGDSNLWARADAFDTDPYLWNFTNGTVDVRDLRFYPHRREDLITRLIPHAYNTTAGAPRWEALVARCFTDASTWDGLLLRFVQKALGYTLVGRNFERAIFLVGEVENCGKTKLLEIPAQAVGDDYAHKAKTELISRVRQHHDSELFSVEGRCYVYISETSSLFNLDEQRVKELTGDRFITTRKLYKSEERNPPITSTIWLAVNSYPNVLEWDAALQDRVICLPAGPRLAPAEVEKDVAETILETEAEGVLAWLVTGANAWYRDWQAARKTASAAKTGLLLPPSVVTTTQAYARKQDHVGRFIEECVVIRPGAKVPAKQVHDEFKRWRGRGETSDRNKLYAEVRKLSGVEYDGRVFRGIEIRPPEMSDLLRRANDAGVRNS